MRNPIFDIQGLNVHDLVQADLLHKFAGDMSLEQLTDMDQLQHQLQADSSTFASKYANISAGLCEVVDDYSLTSVMTPLSIDDAESVQAVVDLVDQANGFALCGLTKGRAVDPYNHSSHEEEVALGSDANLWKLPDSANVGLPSEKDA